MASALEQLRLILREDDIPFFEDETLASYLAKYNNNVSRAAYDCLLIKAEESSLDVSGLNIADSSAYFRRLASMHRPKQSRLLGG